MKLEEVKAQLSNSLSRTNRGRHRKGSSEVFWQTHKNDNQKTLPSRLRANNQKLYQRSQEPLTPIGRQIHKTDGTAYGKSCS